MPLSEHEQRLLDQIERALYAEDPKFASTVRGARLRRPSRRRRLYGIIAFLVGVALLVFGVIVPLKLASIPIVSVLGFLVMFVGALLTLTTLTKGGASAEGVGQSGGTPHRSGFAQRMEDRFRKRFEEE
jgi:protein-S-isoprenylcysteine O-methyltransferase Ste14